MIVTAAHRQCGQGQIHRETDQPCISQGPAGRQLQREAIVDIGHGPDEQHRDEPGYEFAGARHPPTSNGERSPHRRIITVWVRSLAMVVCGWLTVGAAIAVEIQVAVASSFSRTAGTLATEFEKLTGTQVTLIPGSTGKHFSQITNGAPFDIFLAADEQHPAQLEDHGHAVRGTRFTYATGTLVLWSPVDGFVDDQGRVLEGNEFRHLGMAHPDLAPFGLAARETLESLGLWKRLQSRLVRGENVGQAFQFIASGNAELGFVSLSQITRPHTPTIAGSYWQVPRSLYRPIEQQAVLLRDSKAARDFLKFLEGDKARRVIHQDGYQTPTREDL